MANEQCIINWNEDMHAWNADRHTWDADRHAWDEDIHAFITGKLQFVFSNTGVRTTVSDTIHDTAEKGVNRIYFVTDGALTTVADTGGYIALSTAIDSSSTYTAGSVLFVRDSKKVVCSSHGAQMLYLNP